MTKRPLPTHLMLAALLLVATGCASSKGNTQSDNAKAASADQTKNAASQVELIDREVLFGNADRRQVRISPNGEKLAYLAPKDGVMNVWVAPIDDLEAAKPVTDNQDRGIPFYRWAYTNDHILFGKDKDGNENWHIYRVDLASGSQKDLTPYKGVKASIQELSPSQPKKMLAAINKRNKKYHDLYRIDLASGKTEMIQKNTGKFASWVTDDNFAVRLAARQDKKGGTNYLKPDGEGGWTPLIELSRKDALTTNV
ncbi:MAG: TolB family protein, partial [Bradymonadaceae bacterium]